MDTYLTIAAKKYPKWHHKPLRLTKEEMTAPETVFSLFFSRYTLFQIRDLFNELFRDALRADDNNAHSHLITHEDIDKLIEAAWVLNYRLPQSGSCQYEKPEHLKDHFSRIRGFFDGYSYPIACRYLITAVKAAESKKMWRLADPASLLHFSDRMRELITISFDFVRDQRPSVGSGKRENHLPDITNVSLYYRPGFRESPFDYFPRSLTAKEFKDPFRAIKRFTKMVNESEWQSILKEITEYALCKNGFMELGNELPVTRITDGFLKLLDAANLLDIRFNRSE